MAAKPLLRLHSVLSRFSSACSPRCAQTCLVPSRQKSSSDVPSMIQPISGLEIGVTSDGKTIVCFHPAPDIPYDLTQPVERPDPTTTMAESHDQVIKAHLCKEEVKDKVGPTIEELSKMFYTTKHRWYPVGLYHMNRRKKNPPKDR